MRYIDSLKLINLALENNILKQKEDNICVYRNATLNSKEGWYLTPKNDLAQELMNDEEGQKFLIKALKDINIDFV